MVITSETQVKDIAVEYPTAIPVLERLGIDYCCGGKHTLTEACAHRAIKLGPVLEELEHQQRTTGVPETQWHATPMKEIIDYIVSRHHAFTRDQITLIGGLLTKVESRHGAGHPEVFEISKVFAAVSGELTHHFFCEESMLFPSIAKMETDPKAGLPPAFDSVERPASQNLERPAFENVEQPIRRMMLDHDQAGEELRVLRELTQNYTTPPDACPTWRALYRALENLEQDLHQHIHLENNILFPRALACSTVTA